MTKAQDHAKKDDTKHDTKKDEAKHDHEQTGKDFDAAVNMTPAALRKHLDSEASQSVGQKDGGGEATGHKEGRRILEIKAKKKAELTDDDYAHMQKVVGYVRRHLAQGGKSRNDPESAWSLSLMNWGHDPSKD
ncbi:hypothetical protein AFCDBAGC_2133 [Methylobacterium cerastii]|uniref:DNA-binding protein n=1 Tax=Methylobacterium cerastii TaxID=932741 RepID=A0ABQ4QGK8_9HYPH|nr:MULTISPECIES: DUF3140 domain-containing protein [Methylobacterium]TXN04957.1 DUF3140 domain-containing protein [Methylobacterium sp. WL122]TXN83388.1 DUF3140 domain-containing protein [Methylobacterium sp. WL8]GJD44267.1 hypothetical protein AFCDBAGC_2133 [Methylobacterium cerastii]